MNILLQLYIEVLNYTFFEFFSSIDTVLVMCTLLRMFWSWEYHSQAARDFLSLVICWSGSSPWGTLWTATPRPLIETKQSRGLHRQESLSRIIVATDVSRTKFVCSLVASGADSIKLITEESKDNDTDEWCDAEDETVSTWTKNLIISKRDSTLIVKASISFLLCTRYRFPIMLNHFSKVCDSHAQCESMHATYKIIADYADEVEAANQLSGCH